jgi:sulfoxide reductase catalytic subunit YedY
MLIKKHPSWAMAEADATSEHIYLNRREWLRAAGFAGLGLTTALTGVGGICGGCGRLPLRVIQRRAIWPIGSTAISHPKMMQQPIRIFTNLDHQRISGNGRKSWLLIRGWSQLTAWLKLKCSLMPEDLIAKAGGLEERLYRHRCVEAWAMAVPWSGVPLANLVKLANPKPEAKYLQMETFLDPSIAPGQKQSWYPWPYVEGLTLAEATNELAFLATGIYGKPMPAQNGAPIRLVTPWKYGFKSVKSITRFTFTDKQPVSFWEQLNGNEYGFWANVNPDVPHPRWSQKTERLLGSNKNVRTQLYNGYGEQVAGLYDGMFPNDDRKLFH